MPDQWFPSVGDEMSVYGTVSHIDSAGDGIRAQMAQDPGLAQRASSIAAAAPNLTPGTVYALALGGADPGHPAVETMATETHRQALTAQQALNQAGLGDNQGDRIFKGVVRSGIAALQSPFQETQGLQRDAMILGNRYGGQTGQQVGGALAGAGTGAAAGALIGSVVPVIGTGIGAAIGGIAGGVLGFFGSRDVKVKENARITWNSPAAKAVGDLANGRPVSLGPGFFPNGNINTEIMRTAAGVTIDGQPITGGRLIFHDVGDPSIAGHHVLSGLVDAAAMLEADPVNIGLKGLGNRIAQARHFVPPTPEAGRLAGLIGGADTKAVLPELADKWLQGPTAAKVSSAIADEKSPYVIWKEAFKKQIPFSDARTMAQIDDPNHVLSFLRTKIIDGSVYDKPNYGTMRASVQNVLSRGPFSPDVMPNGGRISLDSADSAAKDLDSYLTALKGGPVNALRGGSKLSEAEVARHVEQMGSAAGREDMFKALTDSMETIATHAIGAGADPAKVEQLTSIWRDGLQASHYGVDDVGANMRAFSLKVDGHNINLPDPQLMAEHLGSQVYMPDVRELRRTLSAWRPVLTNPAIALPRQGLEALNKTWALTHVASAATSLRIMAEGQLGLAARGMDSMFRNPASMLGWMAGQNEGRVSELLAKLPGVAKTGGHDIMGEIFQDAANSHADLTNAASLVDPVGSTRMIGKQIIPRTQPARTFLRGWQEEVDALAGDTITRYLAQNGPDGTKDAIAGGPLKSVAAKLGRPELATRQGISDYVDGLNERLAMKTGGDQRLLDYITHGGQQYVDPALGPAEGSYTPEELKGILSELYDKDIGPKFVTADRTLMEGPKGGVGKRAMDWWMNHVFTQPQSYTTNAPALAQTYWQRVGQLFPEMTPEAQDFVRAAAAKENTTGLLRDIGRSGELSAEHVDHIASGFAGEEYLKLIHDTQNRGQFADQLRLLSPFLDAHIKLVKRWSNALLENPDILRKAQMGLSEANNDGFFHADSTGKKVFSFPLDSFATKAVFGIPTNLEGDPSRPLSFVSQGILPTLGPVASIPASMLIPDRPGAADAIRSLAGASPQVGTGFGATAQAELPSWAQAALSAVGDVGFNRQHANNVKEAIRYLTATGKYDLSTPEGQQKLRSDASWRATGLGILSAIGKFVSPTGMTEVPLTDFKDDNGKTFTAQALSNEYYKMRHATGDSAKATQDFFAKYGPNAVGYIQGMSAATIPGAPTTTEGGDWVKAHPELRDQLPKTFALFAPVGAKFDPAVVSGQYDSADRVNLTPEEYTRAMASRLASWQYQVAKDKLTVNGRVSTVDRQLLTQLHTALITSYPGYGDPIIGGRLPFSTLLPELRSAVTNPTVMATGAGQGLAVYLQARDQLASIAKKEGNGDWATSKNTVDLRDIARQLAAALAQQYPDFENVWNNALQRELRNDGA